MIWQPEFTDKILSRKPGAVQKTARVKGSQLAKDPEVLAFIARKQCETVEVDEVPVYRQKKSE
ncbi:hypothetical protein MMT35_28900, partial [Escherichia coli]|nr:hypothetical protein [Escherichia coli]